MDVEMEALARIVKWLQPFDRDVQTRIIASVRLMLDIPNVKCTINNES